MRTSLSLIACTVVSLLAVGTIFAGSIAWLAHDLDLESMAREGERRYVLDIALSRSHERREALDHVVDGLVDGTVPLVVGVEESRALQGEDRAVLEHMRSAFGGESDDEVLARHLLVRVTSRLSRSPELHAQVMPRLEAEFKELYPLTNSPVVNWSHPWMGPRREGNAGPSNSTPVDPGL
jgi:hypothetical protein